MKKEADNKTGKKGVRETGEKEAREGNRQKGGKAKKENHRRREKMRGTEKKILKVW